MHKLWRGAQLKAPDGRVGLVWAKWKKRLTVVETAFEFLIE